MDDDAQLSPFGVSLHYLTELYNTTETNILAKGVDLLEVVSEFVTESGASFAEGDTVEQVKRAGFFSPAVARAPGVEETFEIPRSKIRPKPRSKWTIADVVEYVVKPAVAEQHVALASAVDRRHVNETPWDLHYVSVPRSARLDKLVEALHELFPGKHCREVYLWLEFTHVSPSLLEDESLRAEYEKVVMQSIRLAKGDHLVFFPTWGFKESRARPTNAALRDAQILWETACRGVDAERAMAAALADVTGADDAADLTDEERSARELEAAAAAARAARGRATKVIMSRAVGAEMRNSMRSHGLEFFEDMLLNATFERAHGLAVPVEELCALLGVPQLRAVEATMRKQLERWFISAFAAEVPKLAKKKDILFGPTARAVNRVAVLHSRMGDLSAAIELFDYVIRFTRLGEGKNTPALAYALNNKALLLEKQGALEEAIALLEEAVRILESQKRHEIKCAVIAGNLCTALEGQGHHSRAEVVLKKLVALRRKGHGSSAVEVALALNRLGKLQTELGHLDDAKANLLEALSIMERAKNVREDDANLAEVIDRLATVYDLETNHTPDDGSGHHQNVAQTLLQLARVYKQEHGQAGGEPTPEEEEYGRRGLAILSDVLGEDHPETRKYEEDLLT